MSRNAMIAACVVAIACICALYLSVNANDDGDAGVVTEYDIVAYEQFELVHETTGTKTSGICYVTKHDSGLQMRVVSEFHIGPDDFGGVSFYFPPGLEIQRISSNIGEDRGLIDLWTTADEGISSAVNIGRGIGAQPVGQYDGNIEICLTMKCLEEDCHVLIAAGSHMSDEGHAVIGSVHKDIALGSCAS